MGISTIALFGGHLISLTVFLKRQSDNHTWLSVSTWWRDDLMTLGDFHDPWTVRLLNMRVYLRLQDNDTNMMTTSEGCPIRHQRQISEIMGPTLHVSGISGRNVICNFVMLHLLMSLYWMWILQIHYWITFSHYTLYARKISR